MPEPIRGHRLTHAHVYISPDPLPASAAERARRKARNTTDATRTAPQQLTLRAVRRRPAKLSTDTWPGRP